jgi:hypothetical protein
MNKTRKGGSASYSVKNLLENGKFDLDKTLQKFNENTVIVRNKSSVPGWYFDANIYKSNNESGMFPVYNESEYFACLIGPGKLIVQDNVNLTKGKYKIQFERCKMFGTDSGNLYIGMITDEYMIKEKIIKNISTERWVHESLTVNINKDGEYSIIFHSKDNNPEVAFGISNIKLLKTSDIPNSNTDSFRSIHEPLSEITNHRSQRLQRGKTIHRELFERSRMGAENTRRLRPKKIRLDKINKIKLNNFLIKKKIKINREIYIDKLKKHLSLLYDELNSYQDKIKEIEKTIRYIDEELPKKKMNSGLVLKQNGIHRETYKYYKRLNPNDDIQPEIIRKQLENNIRIYYSIIDKLLKKIRELEKNRNREQFKKKSSLPYRLYSK